MKDQKKRAVKTRPFGREASILSEKCAKCVIFKENKSRREPNFGRFWESGHQTAGVRMLGLN
jgi:hypothetical protein